MGESVEQERPCVLIVEDNQVNRMVARQMLRHADIEAVEADGGRRALELLQDKRFDLVLMDVQMPGMDGLETTRAIRRGDAGEHSRTVPILALTAYATAEDEASCLNAGMDSYLSKPLAMEKFLTTVRAMIEGGRERR